MFEHGEHVIWRRWVDDGIDEYGGKLPGTYVEQVVESVGFAPEESVEDRAGHRVLTTAKLVVAGSPAVALSWLNRSPARLRASRRS